MSGEFLLVRYSKAVTLVAPQDGPATHTLQLKLNGSFQDFHQLVLKTLMLPETAVLMLELEAARIPIDSDAVSSSICDGLTMLFYTAQIHIDTYLP